MEKSIIKVLIFTFISCMHTVDFSKLQKIPIESICYIEDRKIIKTLKNEMFVIGEKAGNKILIYNALHYSPCNLNDSIMKVNDTLIISGLVLESLPNEKLIGIPLKVTSAYKKK